MHILTYGSVVESVDNYVQMGESSVDRGFPDMIGSIDCML